MKSMPASSASLASARHSGQVAAQRSGTLVAERPDEQLAPNRPILSALPLYMAMRSCMDALRASTGVLRCGGDSLFDARTGEQVPLLTGSGRVYKWLERGTTPKGNGRVSCARTSIRDHSQLDRESGKRHFELRRLFPRPRDRGGEQAEHSRLFRSALPWRSLALEPRGAARGVALGLP